MILEVAAPAALTVRESAAAIESNHPAAAVHGIGQSLRRASGNNHVACGLRWLRARMVASTIDPRAPTGTRPLSAQRGCNAMVELISERTSSPPNLVVTHAQQHSPRYLARK